MACIKKRDERTHGLTHGQTARNQYTPGWGHNNGYIVLYLIWSANADLIFLKMWLFIICLILLGDKSI